MFIAAVTAIAIAVPVAANAQEGAASGAATGAISGAVIGGPVGAAVGGIVGAVAGGISDADRPRFREYVEREHIPSYTYRQEVEVGTVLPDSDVIYYEVPEDYGPTPYRYTVVNHQTVLVDPETNRIVAVIE